MTPIIYINPMPESCGKCDLMQTDGKIFWCPLCLDENNDMIEIEQGFDRLPQCPLKPLVLCGECKHKGDYVANGVYWCEKWALMVKADHFCKDGVKA